MTESCMNMPRARAGAHRAAALPVRLTLRREGDRGHKLGRRYTKYPRGWESSKRRTCMQE